jgi:hypothetical protein
MALCKRLYSIAAILLAVLVISACAGRPYPNAISGLVEVDHPKSFDKVLIAPGTRLPAAGKVFVEDPTVTMNNYWLTNYRGEYTDRDLQRIKTRYSKLLTDSLVESISENRAFTLVDSAIEADIIFRPTLASLNIYAPDLSFSGRIDQYVSEAGNATFDLVLIDRISGQPLAQFVDHRETSKNPGMVRERANRATNARYFGQLMDRWAKNLMAYLTDPTSFSATQ